MRRAHSVAQGVADGVKDALKEPKRIIDIPVGTDPDFMDLLVTSDGALQFLVNPLPQAPLNAGALRQVMAQQKIDAFLDG